MLWEIWANIEGNKHFPNTRQKNKQNLGILVRFDHAVKHKSLRTPPPRINTRSSHLSLWFFSYFWDEHSPEFSTFSSACSGSSLALTYDSALVTSSTILEDLLRKSRSWTSGLMEKLDRSRWIFSSLWAGFFAILVLSKCLCGCLNFYLGSTLYKSIHHLWVQSSTENA